MSLDFLAEMTPQFIFAQSLSIVGVIITFISYQLRTQKQIIVALTVATAVFIAHYLLLPEPAYSGAALNVVCIIRNIVYNLKNNVKPLAHKSVPFILAAAMVVVGALSWTGYESLIVLVALAINTIFMSIDNPQLLRKSLLLTCSMILIYNVIVFSVGGIINESIAIISAIVGLARYRKDKNQVTG